MTLTVFVVDDDPSVRRGVGRLARSAGYNVETFASAEEFLNRPPTSEPCCFYRYQDGFLHEKAMLIDDYVSTIGTANLDNRSFRLNFEITGVVVDPAFATSVERMFEQDFAKSELVEGDELEGRSFWFKLAVRLAALTSPIQ